VRYACSMSAQSMRELQPGDVMSGRDAANEMGVHFTTLYRWVKANKIVYINFGGNIFIPVLEVERVKRERNKQTTGVNPVA
jgi:excisionase family DNA binding protein